MPPPVPVYVNVAVLLPVLNETDRSPDGIVWDVVRFSSTKSSVPRLAPTLALNAKLKRCGAVSKRKSDPRTAGTTGSTIVKFASVASPPELPTPSRATTRMRAWLVLIPLGTVQRNDPSAGRLVAMVVGNVLPPSVD